jgi:hypothetical protein
VNCYTSRWYFYFHTMEYQHIRLNAWTTLGLDLIQAHIFTFLCWGLLALPLRSIRMPLSISQCSIISRFLDFSISRFLSNDRDVSSCLNCPMGWHALEARPYIHCAACTRGMYGAVTGAHNATMGCLACLPGKYSEDFGLAVESLVDHSGVGYSR